MTKYDTEWKPITIEGSTDWEQRVSTQRIMTPILLNSKIEYQMENHALAAPDWTYHIKRDVLEHTKDIMKNVIPGNLYYVTLIRLKGSKHKDSNVWWDIKPMYTKKLLKPTMEELQIYNKDHPSFIGYPELENKTEAPKSQKNKKVEKGEKFDVMIATAQALLIAFADWYKTEK